MGEISAASHLQLQYAGPSGRRPRDTREILRVVGGSPVLVSFATREEVPRLDGATAGLGGSASTVVNGVVMYVSGQATLNSEYVNESLQSRSGQDRVRFIALHELGHVIGLDHAPGSREVMNANGWLKDELGPGDRRGLAILGQGPCN